MNSGFPLSEEKRKPSPSTSRCFTVPEWFIEKVDPERTSTSTEFAQFLYNKYLSKPAGEPRREYLRELTQQSSLKRPRPEPSAAPTAPIHPDPDIITHSSSHTLAPTPHTPSSSLPLLRPLTQKQQTIRLAVEMQLQLIALSYHADIMDMRAVYRAWLMNHQATMDESDS